MTRVRDRLLAEERGVYTRLPVQPNALKVAIPSVNYAHEAWAIRNVVFTGEAYIG